MSYLLLIVSLGVILAAAEIFTNGVEWLGFRLRLNEGVVGSILAAVGTALPESFIPIIAFLLGKGVEQHHIGVGAIIGAPFMLSTLAFFICGLVVLLDARKRSDYPALRINLDVIKRDLFFFVAGYGTGIAVAFIPNLLIKKFFAFILLALYGFYVYLTLRSGTSGGHTSELRPLYFNKSKHNPRLVLILLQVIFALTVLVVGANLFIESVTRIAHMLGIPSFFLSLIIAPIATELPEKFNSIIWLKQQKDTLAIGNITGAMVFQSVILPSIAIFFGNWQYVSGSIIPVLLTYASTGLVLLDLIINKRLSSYILLAGCVFYLIFLGTTLYL